MQHRSSVLHRTPLIDSLLQFACNATVTRLVRALLLALVLVGPASSQRPTATIGPTAEILPPPSNYQFPDGQSFVYSVEYHLFSAGTATVTLDSAGTEHRVKAIADSTGVANMVYAVHDRFEARFDPSTFCSLGVTKHTEEGSHKRDTQVTFDYPNRKSILREKNLKTGESKQLDNDIPRCVTDVVTAFFYVAALPLKAGKYYRFPVNDGGKTAEVGAQVEGNEPIKVPAGSYSTIRVSAEAITGNLKGRGKVWAWFTNDASRTPVQMRAKLSWGTLLFRLQRIDHH
jgi:uncharacterized protein DUF3108